MSEQRLDKWLWCARLVKTRSGAARAVAEGKVRINGERALKPSRLVREGDVVTATTSGRQFVVRVLAWTARRGPASLARTLYEDLTPATALSPESSRSAGKGPRPRSAIVAASMRCILVAQSTKPAGQTEPGSPRGQILFQEMAEPGNIVLPQRAPCQTSASPCAGDPIVIGRAFPQATRAAFRG